MLLYWVYKDSELWAHTRGAWDLLWTPDELLGGSCFLLEALLWVGRDLQGFLNMEIRLKLTGSFV